MTQPDSVGPGHPPKNPNTAVRRALLWWFQAPADAHVSLNFAIDFGAARAYLSQLADQGAADDRPRVTVQHLVAAAIARALHAHPLANAQIIRNRIVMREHVGLAMPINLLGHPGGARRELGLAVIERAQTLSLRELAASSRKSVGVERSGHSTNRLIGAVTRVAELVPQALFFRFMDGFERLRQAPFASRLVFDAVPATTLLSNAGAPFAAVDGLLFRGAAVSPPSRLGHVGTVWGLATVQDEVLAVEGQPRVRPMLPVLLLFDHRLIDGVAGGKLALAFAQIIADPQTSFGPDGDCQP